MTSPTSSRTAFVSLLGVLALSVTVMAQRPSAGGRPVGGGGGSSIGGGGGRPSAPSVSRPSMPSAPSVSRPAPSPSYQRGSPAPSPSPQRGSSAPSAPSTPRYTQPAAPRYTAPTPRYEQPSTPRYEQPSAPRYEQPGGSRYEQPTAPRYEAPSARTTDTGGSGGDRSGDGGSGSRFGGSRDATGRVYDGGSQGRGGLAGGRLDGANSRGDYRGAPDSDGTGRIDPARIDRSTPTPYQPRVWQPDPVVDLSGAVRQPRAGVPSISGSRSGPDGGLASGRLARAGLDASRPAAAVPHPEVNGDSLRARYGAAQNAPTGRAQTGDVRRGGASSGGEHLPGLSGGRTGASGRKDAPARTSLGDASGRSQGRAGRTIDGDPGRGDAHTRGCVRAGRGAGGMRRAGEAERTNPEVGHRLRAAGKAANAAGTVGVGVVVGSCTGYYGGCWDPCYDSCWNDCGWYWNSCWYGGWWWSWSFGWPYGSCWWGWPSYYGSCWPWGYGYSYWGWGYSPWLYTTIVYEDYSTPVAQEPAPQPVEPAAENPGVNVPAAGAVPKVAPEVKAGLEATADEALVAGDAAFREGRYSDAVRHYARAVELSPERGSLWLILSDALFATGDYHYAAYAFRRSLEIDATLLETIVDKHGWYTDPAEFDRHIAWAEAYLRDHVLDEDARLILAANYLFSKRFASASDVLESAFGAGLLETPAGKLVLERSRRAMGYGAK